MDCKTKVEADKSGCPDAVPDWIIERLNELRQRLKGSFDG